MKNTWLDLLPLASTRALESDSLHLPAADFLRLLELFGPSLALWRGAEIAVLRELSYERPILDLGCGDGIVTSFVLRDVDVGLDPDGRALAKAAERGIYRELIAEPAERANLPEASIGTVVSNSVLEHIPDIDTVISTVGHLLRPGGRFIFTTPSDTFSRWLAVPSARYAAWRNRHWQHLNLWSRDHWSRCLEHAGMEIVDERPYLRRRLVMAWDSLDLLESVWVAGRRLFGMLWKRLPCSEFDRMARALAGLDLASTGGAGGGQRIVARKI